MTDFTASWHWPQWTILALLALRWLLVATQHGKPMLQNVGDEKGQPLKYNAFGVTFGVALYAFALICGGFFG